jgi:hypothetical protein
LSWVISNGIFEKNLAKKVIGNFEKDFYKSRENIQKINNLCLKWLVNNFDLNGYFIYLYDPELETYPDNNNVLRQLMASRIFAALSHKDSNLSVLHKKNLNYIFSTWYRESENIGYIFAGDVSKLGTIAMALRTISYSPYFDDYSEEAEKLYGAIKSLQNKNGSFRPFLIERELSVSEEHFLYFYSGEAILSLVEYYNRTKNNSILETAVKSQDYYINEYVAHLEENYYPAYVPWHAQSLNKLFKITGNRQYSDAIFVLNDKLLEIQNRSARPKKEYLGRFYNPKHPEYGSPHSTSDGVFTEGLAYAYEIARLVKDEHHMEKYKNAIILGVHNLMNLQYTEADSALYSYPERFIGGIRANVDNPSIRIDCVQHTIDAFTKILEVFSDEIKP